MIINIASRINRLEMKADVVARCAMDDLRLHGTIAPYWWRRYAEVLCDLRDTRALASDLATLTPARLPLMPSPLASVGCGSPTAAAGQAPHPTH